MIQTGTHQGRLRAGDLAALRRLANGWGADVIQPERILRLQRRRMVRQQEDGRLTVTRWGRLRLLLGRLLI